jgi:HEAT repeat protein
MKRLSTLLFCWLSLSAVVHARQEPVHDDKPLAHWIAQLSAEKVEDRWQATYVLGQLGPQASSAVEPLIALLDKTPRDDEYVRGGAAWALGRIGPKAAAAVPVLMETITSQGHLSVRRNSAAALGGIGAAAKPAVAVLEAALEDKDVTVRVNAAVALWRIDRHAKAMPALVAMLHRGGESAPYEAAVALGQLAADAEKTGTGSERSEASVPAFSEPVAAALIEALAHTDPDVRRAAARSLAEIGPSAVRPLREAVANPNAEVSRGAVEAFGWMGDTAVPVLTAALEKEAKGEAARIAAVQALGRLGPAAKAAESALLKAATDDPSPAVRAAAGRAITKVR